MNEVTILRNAIRDYLSLVSRALASISEEDVAALAWLLLEARRRRSTLYLLGNGGSAATASHAANDIAKTATPPGGLPLRAISLADNTSLLTAWANDTAYENIFAAQLEEAAQPGDVVLGLSGSGNSENVLRAMEVARQRGAIAVGLAGFAGGRLRDASDLCLVVPAELHGAIEDVHLSIIHALTEALRREPTVAVYRQTAVSVTPHVAGPLSRRGDGHRAPADES